MGCCCSLSVTEIQDVSPQKNTRNRPLHKSVPLPPDYQIQKKPFKKTQLNWIADQPMTPSELKQKRDVYWETAVEYSGRKEIWQALQAAFSEEDVLVARSILEAANIILPTGNPCHSCFDELGNSYDIPIFCVVPPENLVLDQDISEEVSLDTETTIPDCSICPFPITIRLTTNRDVPMIISSINETVGSLKERILEAKDAQLDRMAVDLRLIYLGRVLHDTMLIVCLDEEEERADDDSVVSHKEHIQVTKKSVIQVLVVNR
ncbi:Ubiquitin domain-containing protein 2 [Choanephora cucurbitarum]|uniref:Ubiquitin domain-containing protein 2 n=1 Tax=Choanephora cucurbitarum TaxID=101091 RepID=A0A1C7N7J7_9FUNG|nr:Ubiquitin domain-containing protein 2 [Choanephora cucurbitarum]